MAVTAGVLPVTVSVPAGALVAPQAATPPARTAVHRLAEPVMLRAPTCRCRALGAA